MLSGAGYRLAAADSVLTWGCLSVTLCGSTHAERQQTTGKSHRICESRSAQQNSLTDSPLCLWWQQTKTEKPYAPNLVLIVWSFVFSSFRLNQNPSTCYNVACNCSNISSPLVPSVLCKSRKKRELFCVSTSDIPLCSVKSLSCEIMLHCYCGACECHYVSAKRWKWEALLINKPRVRLRLGPVCQAFNDHPP